MNKIFAFICWLFAGIAVFGQTPFKINKNGEVTDGQLTKLIKERKYQLVSGFDTVSKTPVLVYAWYYKNNKTGLLDIYGKEVTKPIYDDIAGLNWNYNTTHGGYHQYFTVKKSGKYGLLNKQGKEIIPAKYGYIEYFEYRFTGENHDGEIIDSLFKSTTGDSIIIFNTKGKIVSVEVQEPQLDADVDMSMRMGDYDLGPDDDFGGYTFGENSPQEEKLSNGLHITSKRINHKYYWGVNGSSGGEIIPFIYSKIESDDRGNFIIKDTLGKYGVLDSTGAVILATEYERIALNYEESVLVRKNGKFGLTDVNYNFITLLEYDDYTIYTKGFFAFKKDGKMGLVSTKGKVVTEFEYDHFRIITDCRNEHKPIIIATKNGKKGILDTLGNTILPFEHEELLPECRAESEAYSLRDPPNMYSNAVNYYYYYKKNGKYGLYDTLFKQVLYGYDMMLKSMDDNIVYISQEVEGKSLWGMYNFRKDSVVAPPVYDYKIEYKSGYFVVESNKLYGALDQDGREIIPVKETKRFYLDRVFQGLLSISFPGSNEEVYQDYTGKRVTITHPR